MDQPTTANYSYSMLVDKMIKTSNPPSTNKKNPLSVSKERLPPRSTSSNSQDKSKEKKTPDEVKEQKKSFASVSALSAASVSALASARAGGRAVATSASHFINTKKVKDDLPDVSAIETRRVHTWVRDSMIHNCYSCKCGFTMINRKHHCRLCGRIFCSECTKYRQKIPNFLITYLPKRTYEPPSVSRLISDSDKTIGNTLKNIRSAITTPLQYQGQNSEERGRRSHDELGKRRFEEGARDNLDNPIRGSDPINVQPNYGTMNQTSPSLDPRGPRPIIGRSPTTTILMDQYISSPNDNSENPEKETSKTLNQEDEISEPQRLCKPCFVKLNELTHLRYLIDLFAVPGTTIKDLKNYSLVCKDWLHIASYHLSSFREMQYYLPYHKFSKYDRQMLWDNRYYLLEHGTWLTQLVRSIDYREGEKKIKELIQLLGLNEFQKVLITMPSQDELNSNEPIVDFRRPSGRIYMRPSEISEVLSETSNIIVDSFKFPKSRDPIKPISTINSDLPEIKQSSRNSVSQESTDEEGIKKIKRVSCWSLMCTRTCQTHLRAEDAIIILDYHTQAPELRSWAMSELLKTDLDELRCYLPVLVHHMRYESIEQSVIGRGLLDLISKRKLKGLNRSYQLLLANDLYWQLSVAIENRTFQSIYRYFIEEFCKIDRQLQTIIFKGKSANSLIQTSINSAKDFTEEQIKHILELELKNGVMHSPTNPFLDYQRLHINKIKQTNSNSKPIILPFTIQTPTLVTVEKNILYKNEDLRKDKIIMNLIKLANMILKREEDLDLGLITYEICPTTSHSGFLEMVPRSKTLYDIKERLNLSINNYIDGFNDSISVQALRTRFLRSCAGYCVITYLLGIGDRHLDNIMITEDGYIFHIDYGFILGADPKPMTKPKMRLTDDMVSAMGGTDSKYYLEFKDISNRVYNCLRRHIGLFIIMLDLLTDADPVIENKVPITKEHLIKEINKRFVPGETYSEAQILLETEIENSNQTYTHAINDFFHYHAKEKTLKTAFGSTFKSIKGFFQ